MSAPRPSRARLLTAVVALLCFFEGSPAFGQASEDQVKAAYIYSFAKFIEWPPGTFTSSSSPFHFCVLNDRSFQAELDRAVKGKSVGGHSIDVVSVRDADQSRSCHLLFIDKGQEQQARQIVKALRGSNILTIGETAHFIDGGGMIGFLLEDNHIYFEINHKAATASGLYVSSRLLSVARRVIE
jgi:hypothetical protein